MDEKHKSELQAYLIRMQPKTPSFRYFAKGRGPRFIWTTETFNLLDGNDPANGKYESAVYMPIGKGSRSGKATNWERDESQSSLHTLRKDAKARAWKLYKEWEASNG